MLFNRKEITVLRRVDRQRIKRRQYTFVSEKQVLNVPDTSQQNLPNLF